MVTGCLIYQIMLKMALWVLVLVTSSAALCPGKFEIEGIQSGILEMSGLALGTSTSIVSRQYTHTFSASFQQVPSIAFGVMESNFSADSAASFNQFSMELTDTSTASATFRFAHANRIWTKIKITLLANIRPDVLLATSAVGNHPLMHVATGALSQSKYVAVQQQGKQILSYSTAIGRAFLNGLQIQQGSTAIQVQIQVKNIRQAQVEVEISVGSRTILNKVWFSLVVFDPFGLPFASYGSMIAEESFAGYRYRDLQNIVQFPKYILFGLARINGGFQADHSLNIDNDMVATLTNRLPDFSIVLSYIVLGSRANQTCQGCPGQPLMYYQQCLMSCPAATYLHYYKNGGTACHRCSLKLKEVLNREGTGCECLQGYQKVNGTCISAAVVGVNNVGTGSIPIDDGLNDPNRVTTPVINPVVASNSTSTTPPPVNPSTTAPPIFPATLPINLEQFSQQTPQSCSKFANTYWTGYHCACRVGYRYDDRQFQCARISFNPDTNFITPNPQLCGVNAYFNGYACVCSPGFFMAANKTCISDLQCPGNSTRYSDRCICNTGFVKVGDICVFENGGTCGAYSYRNYLGYCLCFEGYAKNPQTNLCEEVRPCGDNEIFNTVLNICQCLPSFYRNQASQKCLRCLAGQIWNRNRCQYVCGINQEYNQFRNQCQCRAGLGKAANGICSVCAGQFFLWDGYCVTCPINSQFNPLTTSCTCKPGFQLRTIAQNVQQCLDICNGANQYYDDVRGACRCRPGLAQLRPNQCGICPTNTFLNSNTQKCQACGANQYISGLQCVCNYGFGIVAVQPVVCARCQDRGMFLKDGFCASCPTGQAYNGETCVCPNRTEYLNGRCSSACKPGQLIDFNNNCYICPYNEVAVGQQCECRQGFASNFAGVCQRQECSEGQRLIQGRCGACALNTVYNQQKQACMCPTGYFLNVGLACQKIIIPPKLCSGNTYLDLAALQCRACPPGCSKCTSQTQCTECSDPKLTPSGSQCAQKCGNGIKAGLQACDDGNTYNGDGCSASCNVQIGYTCIGVQPSLCIRPNSIACGNGRPDPLQSCDDNNTIGGDGCSQYCAIQANYTCTPATTVTPSSCQLVAVGMSLEKVVQNVGAVYVIFRTTQLFVFANAAEMENFIQPHYQAGTQPSSSYCLQDAQNRQIFSCAFFYPQGIPQRRFNIQLRFSRRGIQGRLSVQVNGLANYFATRSLNR